LQGDYERPWQSQVPPLEQSVDIVEKFPSDEEENGMVTVAWRGPLAEVVTVMLLYCIVQFELNLKGRPKMTWKEVIGKVR